MFTHIRKIQTNPMQLKAIFKSNIYLTQLFSFVLRQTKATFALKHGVVFKYGIR